MKAALITIAAIGLIVLNLVAVAGSAMLAVVTLRLFGVI